MTASPRSGSAVTDPGAPSGALAARHDVLLVDLDGTLVLAGQPIEHAASMLRRSRELGARAIVVTNNASRSPASVAARLTGLGIPMGANDIVSSPLAAARMLADAHEPGDPVLVVGADALAAAVGDAGLAPVRSADERPVAVVQGYSPEIGWRDLAEACIALRGGADWVATNTDVTLPTDRGLLPGNGSLVQALVTATGREPRVAGKPARPLLDAAVDRAGATRPLVVGDRLDTDIAAAVAADLPSLLVLSGVSTPADLLIATPAMRPTLIAWDLRGLVDPGACQRICPDALPADAPDRTPAARADAAAPVRWQVTESGQQLELRGTAAIPRSSAAPAAGTADAAAPADAAEPATLAALAELTRQAWRTGISTVRAADPAAAAALAALGLPG